MSADQRQMLGEKLQAGERCRILSRARRLATNPLATLVPGVARRLGWEKVIEVPTFFGRRMKVVVPEVVSVDIWRYGVFETDVCFYLLSLLRPNDTFIDIGGHFGFFSMLGCELVGPDGAVVTFEPMAATRAVLADNLQKRAVTARRHIVPAAAGDDNGKLFFKDFGLAGSAFATSRSERSELVRLRGEVEVEMRMLDSVVTELGIEQCRLIKIDAENAEYEVIAGGLATIRRLRPALILETGDAADNAGATRRVLDMIAAENYVAIEFDDFRLRLHQLQGTYTYGNILMVPRELSAEIVADAATTSG